MVFFCIVCVCVSVSERVVCIFSVLLLFLYVYGVYSKVWNFKLKENIKYYFSRCLYKVL